MSIRALPLALLLACSGGAEDPPADSSAPGDTAGGALDTAPEDSAPEPCVPEEEVPYDGIDQDCDGADWTDVDGDGFDAAEGTTAEVTGSAITGNHASRAGGAVYQSTVERLTVTDTVVDANTADEGGGAFWVYDGSLDLVDSPVTNNVAPDGGGVYIWSESHVSCTATTEGSGGFWGNVADEGGALYEYGPDSAAPVDELLSSEGCDWGADDADNADDDLSVCHSVPEGSTGGEMYCDDMRYVIDGAPAFSCTDGRCGDEQTGGLEPLEADETGGLIAVGAVFEATGDATLDTISAYIELTENTSLEFYLLSRAPGETGDWTAEWSSSDISRAGADWRTPNTDMAGVPLRAGYSYAFVVGVYKYDGTMTPYSADPAGSIEGIGAVTGAWRDEDYEDRYSWHGESVPDASLPGEAPLAIQVIWYAIGDGAR